MNAVRKHVSAIKGGQFLEHTGGASAISLIVSDVVGDDIGFISSGPTAPDATTFADAMEVLEKYDIYDKAPASIRDRLGKGVRGEIPETPKPGDHVFDRVSNIVVAGNIIALEAAAKRHSSSITGRSSWAPAS